jgi:threonine synthase
LQPGAGDGRDLELDGVLYIAKLESRKDGRVRRFEDEDVQSQISATIRQQRSAEYYQQDRQKLLSESIRIVNPQMFQTALDIAMGSFRVWNAR